jgi:hypothetical protein
MPCFRCGARQTDPDRGSCPWRRGVRADAQVLICPECQPVADLDLCQRCGSADLICRLGDVECRECGHVRAAEPGTAPAMPQPPAGLSEEVAAALDRVLGRGR